MCLVCLVSTLLVLIHFSNALLPVELWSNGATWKLFTIIGAFLHFLLSLQSINYNILKKAQSVCVLADLTGCVVSFGLYTCPGELTLIRLADTNYYHQLLRKQSSLDVWRATLDSGRSRTGFCCSCRGGREH